MAQPVSGLTEWIMTRTVRASDTVVVAIWWALRSALGPVNNRALGRVKVEKEKRCCLFSGFVHVGDVLRVVDENDDVH